MIAATLPDTINFSKGHVFCHCFKGAVRLGASAQTWTESAKHRHVMLKLDTWADPGYLLGPSFQKDTGLAVGLVSHLLASSGWSV